MSRPIEYRFWDGEKMYDWSWAQEYQVEHLFNPDVEVWEVMQFIGMKDRDSKKVFEDDIIEVYDTNRGCMMCDEWESCEGEADEMHKEHGSHGHENPGDCEMYICTQKVKFSYGGYFCTEDTGDYCPSLAADEIEMRVIGNIYQNPELKV